MRPEAARGREGGDCWGQRRQQFLWDTSSDSRRASPTGSGGKPRTTARCSSSSSPSELRCCWKESSNGDNLLLFSPSQVPDSRAKKEGQGAGRARGQASVLGHLSSLPRQEMASGFHSVGFPLGSRLITPALEREESSVWRPPGLRVNGV